MFAGELFKDIDGKFRPGQEWMSEVTDAVRRTNFPPFKSVRSLAT
jgi:hypothetical protein